MKGITIVRDETNNKRFVQIEEQVLEEYENCLEDLFDIISTELRKDEPTISFEDVLAELKKSGKLSDDADV
jgi:hypothetical protein